VRKKLTGAVTLEKEVDLGQSRVVHTYSPSYSGGRDRRIA
jgi:hypothetical protein